MQQTGNPQLSDWAQKSYEILQSLADELELPIPFVETGSILYGTNDALARKGSESIEAALRKIQDEQNQLGIVTDWLDATSLPSVSSGLLADSEATCGIYCAQDGYTNGVSVRDAYLEAFQRLDGEVWFESEAVAINLVDEAVRSVCLADGRTLSTEAVLNCAGIHAHEVNAWVGVALPLTIDRRFLAILERPRTLTTTFPILEDQRHEWYFRPDDRGVLMGIGPTERLSPEALADGDPPLSAHSKGLAHEYMRRFIPRLADARILDAWAGRRPMIYQGSPPTLEDTSPRLGPVEGIRGMFQSAGWGAFGVTLAFIGGELIAEHICGEASSASLGLGRDV